MIKHNHVHFSGKLPNMCAMLRKLQPVHYNALAAVQCKVIIHFGQCITTLCSTCCGQ